MSEGEMRILANRRSKKPIDVDSFKIQYSMDDFKHKSKTSTSTKNKKKSPNNVEKTIVESSQNEKSVVSISNKKEEIKNTLNRLSGLSQDQLNKIMEYNETVFDTIDMDALTFFLLFESLDEINLLIENVQENKDINKNLKDERKRLKKLDKKELSEMLGVNHNLGFSKGQLIDQIINQKRDAKSARNSLFDEEALFNLIDPIYNMFYGDSKKVKSISIKSEQINKNSFLDEIGSDLKEYLMDEEIFDFLSRNLKKGYDFYMTYPLSDNYKNILKNHHISNKNGRIILKRILYDYINNDLGSLYNVVENYINSIKRIKDLKKIRYSRENDIIKLFLKYRTDLERYHEWNEKTSSENIDKLNKFAHENISKIRKFNYKILYFDDTFYSKSKRDELKKDFSDIFNQFPDLDLSFFENKLDKFEVLEQFKEIFKDLLNYKGLEDKDSNYIMEANERYIKKELESNKDFFDDILNYESPNELKKKKISLDYEQRRAVVIDEDNVQIVAGAGTGKTTTLQAKLKYLTKIKGIKEDKILCLSFSNAAVKDLKEKIKLTLGPNEVDIRNFHSLGGEILKDSKLYRELNKTKRVSEFGLDQALDSYFREKVLYDKDKIKKIIDFFTYYFYVPISELETDVSEKYEKEEMVNFYTIRDFINTLDDESRFAKLRKIYGKDDVKITEKRERVKSIEELVIANFLFLNGVEYDYERKFSIERKMDEESGKYTQFKSYDYYPDFYLPKHNLHIEHFGVNEKCESWIENAEEAKKYIDGIHWKRALHEKYGIKLIETYSYYTRDRKLLKRLKEKLEDAGVEFNEINYEELYRVLTENRRLKQFNNFFGLLKTFINLFKGNGFDIDHNAKDKFKEFRENNNINDSFVRERREIFLELAEDIYNYYHEYLISIGRIDFNDMINDAIRELNASKNIKDYEYIIVDEYQDTSETRYRLIKAIKDIHPNTKLIVVGDDWQSIYKFTGCNIKLFTEFNKYFDEPELVKIQNTYRNSQQLLDISGKFMDNDEQIQKRLVSTQPDRDKPIKLLKYKNNCQKVLAFEKAIKNIVKDYNESNSEKELEILVLGRNNADIDKLLGNSLFSSIKYDNYTKIKYNKKEYSEVNINFRTIHKSKGLDAPYVILINLENSVSGFPNKIDDDEIIDYCFKKNREKIPYAEERRLFYVALTRTENDVYLLVPETEESIFVKELRQKNSNLEEIEFKFTKDECHEIMLDKTESNFYENTHLKCPICSGTVRLRYGKYNKYFECSHNACTWYGGPWPKKNSIEELKFSKNCPKCGGILVVKQNSDDKTYFLGCSFFRRENCRGSMNLLPKELEELKRIRNNSN